MKEKADECVSEYLTSGSQLKRPKSNGDELFVGRAGYLAGALWLNKTLGKGIVPRSEIHEICQWIVQSGRKYSSQHASPCPLMYSYYDTEYLGEKRAIGLLYIVPIN